MIIGMLSYPFNGSFCVCVSSERRAPHGVCGEPGPPGGVGGSAEVPRQLGAAASGHESAAASGSAGYDLPARQQGEKRGAGAGAGTLGLDQ